MMLDAFDIGGTETYVLSLAKQLLNQGVNVFVAGRHGPLRKKFNFLQENIFDLNNNNMSKFERWVRLKKINVIHAQLEDSGKYAAKLSIKLKIPLIYTIHGKYYNPKTIRYIVNKCPFKPTIISVSLPIQEWLKEKKIHSTVIPNGIDTEEYRFIKSSYLREKFFIPENATVVLYASRLEDNKYNICRILLKETKEKLLKEFPDLYLLVAGDGKETIKIKNWIERKSNSKRIKFIGKQLDMPSLYSICDYVIGTGRVALEAMSCECPVIAIGSRGTFGIVRPHNYRKAWEYYFCDHKRYRSLNKSNITHAVRNALRLNLKNSNEGQKGRQFIQQQFYISDVANRLRKIYEKSIRKVDQVSRYDKLMIVAHPDDETIFGGAQLLKDKGWKVICVTNGDNKIRRKEFKKVMGKVSAASEIWNYKDQWNGDFDRSRLKSDLSKVLGQNKVKKVVTHSLTGEYGHKQHKVLSKLVHQLVNHDLYVFHTSKKKLNKNLLKKKQLLLKDYKSQDIGWLKQYIEFEDIRKVR